MKARGIFWRPLTILAVLALPLWVAAVDAYVQDRTRETGAAVHWPDPHVELVLEVSTIPMGLKAETVVRALQAAADVWNRAARDGCSALELIVKLESNQGPQAKQDGTNRILFRTERWGHNGSANRRYDRKKLAVTTLAIATGANVAGRSAMRTLKSTPFIVNGTVKMTLVARYKPPSRTRLVTSWVLPTVAMRVPGAT